MYALQLLLYFAGGFAIGFFVVGPLLMKLFGAAR